MNSEQRLEDLFHGLANYERTRSVAGAGSAAAWSLDTMHVLLRELGPAHANPVGQWIQIGGSKGKGTTVLYLESMARAAGLRTGTFLSPHLQSVTERVRIDGMPVSADVLVEALEVVLSAARSKGLEPSFFEAITAAAVRIFARAGVDLVALEVGLGGRLDATTAVPVDATIITKIELEHTDLLGETLEEIATEKAHIMRAGKPVIVHPDPHLAELFRSHARRVGAEWVAPARIEGVREAAGAQPGEGHGELHGELCGELRDGDVVRPFRLVGGSHFELAALALAYAALRRLQPDLSWELAPVARPTLPGRFEVVRSATEVWPFVLDGAHTPASCREVIRELERRFPRQPVEILFASAAGKRWQEELNQFLPLVDRYLVTAPRGTVGVSPDVVVTWLRERGKSARVVASAADGLLAMRNREAVRLIVGSFYLVGEVRTHLFEVRKP